MLKSIFPVLFVFIFTGCASIKHQPLSTESSQSLNGGVITNSLYDTPDFAAMTAGKASFAMVGAVAAIAKGNQIIRENEVPDPAINIGNNLITILESNLDLKPLENNGTKTSNNKINELIKTYEKSDFIMDIQTINWSFIYFPTDWNSYRVMYTARLRLIDSKYNKVIAEEFCNSIPEYEDSNEAPSYEYLTGDNAAGLKTELEKAEKHCTDYFRDAALHM